MRIGAGTLPQIAECARNGRVVVFDTETTGCSRWDEICQIAAAEYEGGVLSRMFSAYVRPTCEMNPWAERVHGLSLDFLSEHGQGRQRVGDSQDGRIKAILKRATLVGHSDHQDYSCEATKAKYDYVSAKIESFPKNSCVHSHFALVKKIMGFIEAELPSLITDNYMFNRSKPVSMQNKAGDIHVTDNKGFRTPSSACCAACRKRSSARSAMTLAPLWSATDAIPPSRTAWRRPRLSHTASSYS